MWLSSDGPFTAYVEGISYEATEDDVQAFFQDKVYLPAEWSFRF